MFLLLASAFITKDYFTSSRFKTQGSLSTGYLYVQFKFYKFVFWGLEHLWSHVNKFFSALGSVLGTVSIANLAHIWMFNNLTLTTVLIFKKKKKLASWNYLLQSNSPPPFQIGLVTHPSALKQYFFFGKGFW